METKKGTLEPGKLGARFRTVEQNAESVRADVPRKFAKVETEIIRAILRIRGTSENPERLTSDDTAQ